jgi:hypothetical protein
MRKLIFIGLLLANTAQAEYLPAGCYVADYYRTDPCWGEDVSYLNWFNYDFTNTAGESAYYGVAVAGLIKQETIYRSAYEIIEAASRKDKALIKKLKRKCGSACRGVK